MIPQFRQDVLDYPANRDIQAIDKSKVLRVGEPSGIQLALRCLYGHISEAANDLASDESRETAYACSDSGDEGASEVGEGADDRNSIWPIVDCQTCKNSVADENDRSAQEDLVQNKQFTA